MNRMYGTKSTEPNLRSGVGWRTRRTARWVLERARRCGSVRRKSNGSRPCEKYSKFDCGVVNLVTA